MATRKQAQAARKNIKKAQAAAKSKRTITIFPRAPGAISAGRPPRPATVEAGQDTTSRTARERSCTTSRRSVTRGRSKMGTWDLIRALRGR